MIRLSEELFRALERRTTVVVPTRQRAAALRLAYAHALLADGRRLWRTPAVLSWSAALERAAQPALEAQGLRLLRPAEEWLLWRRVLEELAPADGLEVRDPIVDGIARAAHLLAEWQIPPVALRAAPGSEAALLARALPLFAGRCRQLRAVAACDLPPLLPVAAAADERELVGFAPLAPAQRSLPGARFGLAAALDTAARAAGALHLAGAADEREEQERAAEWCHGALREDPRRRLLLVVPRLDAQRPRLERILQQRLAPAACLGEEPRFPRELLAIEGGEPLLRYPLVACALEALGLAVRAADFDHVSAWLRRTHHGTLDAAARARLDLWLRGRPRSELDLRTLCGELQRAPEALRPLAQPMLQHLERALEALSLRHGSPAQWAERIERALEALGWPGLRPLDSHERQTLERFGELLAEFAALASLQRALSLREALALLRDLAARVSFRPASGDAAVTLSDAPCDPIARYDGIWVMGLHADAWPEAPRPDPFVPLAAQRSARLPQASVEGRIALARELLARWRRAADTLVLSWPGQLEEGRVAPSALLGELSGATPLEQRSAAPLAARLRAAGAREAFEDESGSAWDAGVPLPAGTRTLELQSACGFRAYAELRLGAQPLSAPRRGIDPRVRGKLLHRTLEKLWRELRDHAGLVAHSPQALAERIERCVRESAGELLAEQAESGQVRLTRREQARAARLVAELCERERERAPFRVVATERQMALLIAGARLEVRIDRIDEVPGLGLAVIDYKTGRAGPRDWFGERPTHPQLLAYREALGEPARLLAMAYLGRREVSFRGIGQETAGLRGLDELRAGAGDAVGAWSAQAARWSRTLAALAGDFLAGRAWVDPAHQACDHCHLHGLCRIHGTEAEPGSPDDD